MASELCMNCFSVKGRYNVCPYCGYEEGTPPEQPHYLQPGTLLASHFIVGTAIGAGGFGITYRCYDATLGVIVAVKEFYPVGLVNRAPGETKVGLLSGDKGGMYHDQMSRFLEEARSIAQFGKVDDIVNVYDYFEENNTAYIIMEYIDGILLQDYLEQHGRLNERVAMQIVDHIIEAVKKIHAKGIIHRDLSPDNIFISGEDSIKVFDFGAAILSSSKEGMTAEKVIKVGYSAPEQYRDTSEQGYYTDIYSIGALLYQMLTGIKPPEASEREYKDQMKSPRELGIDIEKNLDRAVMEAMAVQPELRFAGIVPFEEALHGKRIAEYPKEKIRRRKNRRNWTIAISALAILAIIVGIGVFRSKKNNDLYDVTVDEGTELVIWVDSPGMQEMLRDVIKDIGNDSDDKKDDSKSDRFQKIKDESSTENVTYHVVDVTAEGGNLEKDEVYTCEDVVFGGDMTMEKALSQVKGKKTFPNIFLTDHLCEPEDTYSLASYEDTVYRAIDTENYLYLSQYEKYFPEMDQMPVSFNTVFYYAMGIQDDKDEGLWSNEDKKAFRKRIKKQYSSFLANDNADGTLALEDVLAKNKEKKEYTYLTAETAVRLAILSDPDSFDEKEGTFEFEDGVSDTFVETLFDLLTDSRETQSNAHRWLKSGKKKDGYLYGSGMMAGPEYRSELFATKINGKEPYKVYTMTGDDEKMLVEYTGKLAIPDDDELEMTESQRIAALRFVYFALREHSFSAAGETGFPLYNVKGSPLFERYFKSNSIQDGFRELVTGKYKNHSCVLLGRDSGNIDRFAQEINDVSSKEELKERCSTYTNGTPKE